MAARGEEVRGSAGRCGQMGTCGRVREQLVVDVSWKGLGRVVERVWKLEMGGGVAYAPRARGGG